MLFMSPVSTLMCASTIVTAGAPLMVMEAMKMEHVIKAAMDGEVDRVLFKEGDFVLGNKTLVTFKASLAPPPVAKPASATKKQ